MCRRDFSRLLLSRTPLAKDETSLYVGYAVHIHNVLALVT